MASLFFTMLDVVAVVQIWLLTYTHGMRSTPTAPRRRWTYASRARSSRVAIVAALLIGCGDTTSTSPTGVGGLYLFGATIITARATGTSTLTDHAVVVKGTRITSIEPARTASPPELERIDLAGLTLLPGLIDSHAHILSRPTDVPRILDTYLDWGVTTVKDAASHDAQILTWRDAVAAGREGPRIIAAGPAFTAPGGHPMYTFRDLDAATTAREVSDPEEARSAVAALAASGVDFIKVVLTSCAERCPRLDVAVMQAIIDEAHAHGLLVAVHTDTNQDVADALAAGADMLEHGFAGEAPTRTQIDALAAAGVPVVSTLALFEALYDAATRDMVGGYLRPVWDAGITVVPGSDAAANGESAGLFFGQTFFRELELLLSLTAATEADVVAAATREAARAIGMGAALGTLEVGKLADIIAVAGDPYRDLSALSRENIRYVIKEGRILRQP